MVSDLTLAIPRKLIGGCLSDKCSVCINHKVFGFFTWKTNYYYS